MNLFPICFLFLSFFLVHHRTIAELEGVKRSLVSFLDQLSPIDNQRDPSLDWNLNSDPCGDGWKGVTCDSQGVQKIVLDHLNLSGTLNASLLCQARFLEVLSLNNNSLNGVIPKEIGNCLQLTHLYLTNNRFTGVLPDSITRLKRLTRFDISYNNFSGELPDFSKLPRMLSFLAENNEFKGEIPKFDFSNLQLFNISFNHFSGPLPAGFNGRFKVDSIMGNPGLCGQPLPNSCPELPKEKPKKLNLKAQVLMFSGYMFIALVVVLFIVFKFIFKNKPREEKLHVEKSAKMEYSSSRSFSSKTLDADSVEYYKSGVGKSADHSITSADHSTLASASLVVLNNPGIKDLRFQDLLKAPAELLGRGKFGSLYKVNYEDGMTLSVKRIRGWAISSKKFKTRMEKIDKVKHPHLLPVAAFYSSKQEKLIVYEYQQNGSLFLLLQQAQNGKTFDWNSRLSFAARIAEALAFMHKELLQDGIAHGNIKSSNIIFNNNMEPCISEYGLMAVEAENHPSFSHLVDYKTTDQTRDQPFKVDVYCFGVLLLELLTGKVKENINGMDLATWVQTAIKEEWTVEVFDKALVQEGASEERMVNLLQVALKCVDPWAESRPSMKKVVDVINAIKEEDEMSMVSEAYDDSRISYT